MNNSKSYSWDARDYAKNSQNQYQWAKELIPKLKLQGNEALLDVGCGDGKITADSQSASKRQSSRYRLFHPND